MTDFRRQTYEQIERFAHYTWAQFLEQDHESTLVVALDLPRAGSWRWCDTKWHFMLAAGTGTGRIMDEPPSGYERLPAAWACEADRWYPPTHGKGRAKSKPNPMTEANTCSTCWRTVVDRKL